MPACHLLHPPTILCIHVAHITIHQNGSKWIELLNLPVYLLVDQQNNLAKSQSRSDMIWLLDYLTSKSQDQLTSGDAFCTDVPGRLLRWKLIQVPLTQEYGAMRSIVKESKHKFIMPLFETCPIWKCEKAFQLSIPILVFHTQHGPNSIWEPCVLYSWTKGFPRISITSYFTT